MRNLLVLILLSFSIVNAFIIISPNVHAQITITVGPGGPPLYNFSNINDALAVANNGDIINVYSGTYTENIVIAKAVTINGIDGSGSTTILSKSNPIQHTIDITANNVKISGFRIKNLGGDFSCVKLNSVTNCIISNCDIKNGGNSIYLINSNSNTIKDNTIENNNIGIYLWNSNNNIIKNNNIQNNYANGISIYSPSSENIIYLNDFSGNIENNARDDGENYWDYESEGNYWDDYNDYDINPKDGIGDNPYSISGNGGNQDNFPLGDFLSLSKPVAYIDSISPNPAPKGETISFSGHGTSSDGVIVAWEWKSDNIVISSSASFSTSSLSPGTHSISFRVQDNIETWSEKVYKTLIINSNQKPIAYILEPSKPSIFGSSVYFSGYGADSDGEVTGYMWRSTIPNFVPMTVESFTLTDLTVGNFTIYFKVKDNEGEWSEEVSTILRILPYSTITMDPPVANAKGPYVGFINQNITFDGSLSFDPNSEDILSYHWDFGDDTTGEDKIIQHKYSAVGNYTVELTVTDEHNLQSKDSTYVNVYLQTNNKNNEQGENKSTPGFEIIYVLLIISIIVTHRKINKKRRF